MTQDTGDRSLIEMYIHRRGSMVMDMVSDGLRSTGFSVYRGLTASRYRLDILLGEAKGSIDLFNTLVEIATDGGKFDQRLENSVYEMMKMTTILKNFLRVIVATFESANEQERLQKLQDLTRTSENLKVVYERSIPKAGGDAVEGKV